MIRCASALLFSFIGTAQADSRPKIYWYVNHSPPSMIIDGPRRGQGFVDRALGIIQRNMTEYQHIERKASFARTLADIKNDRSGITCFPALLRKPSREAHMAFSQMSVMHPSNHVTVAKQTAIQHRLPSEIDLSELLKNPALVLGMEQARLYGDVIDEAIRSHAVNTKTVKRSSDSIVGLYKMLSNGRFDYVIGYPFEAHYSLMQIGAQEKFRSIPITGVERYTMGAVGCNKSEQGMRAIAAIDRVLTAQKPRESYRKALSSWLDPALINAEFLQFYNSRFLSE